MYQKQQVVDLILGKTAQFSERLLNIHGSRVTDIS